MLWQKIRNQWWPLVREPARYGLVAAAVASVVSLAIAPSYVVHSAVRATSSSQSAFGGSILGLAQRFGLVPQMGGVSPDMLAVLFETEDVLESVARTRFSRGTFDMLWWTDCPSGAESCDLSHIWRIGGHNVRDTLERTAKALDDRLNVSTSVRTGIVDVSVRAGDPALALAIVHRLIAVVDSTNAAIQRGEATQQVAFISEQVDGARRALRSAEDSLAEFDVANRALLSSPLLQQRRVRLGRSVNLAETFYTQMVAALQQAYVAAANNMSTISIIDPPALPGRRSWPRRKVIALVGFLLGALASTARRYGRVVWSELRGAPE